MAWNSTPYEYAGERPDAGLDVEAPSEVSEGSDPVIVDGTAMTYRSYRRRDELEQR